MSRIIFILGGARSGKSTFAVTLAQKHKKVAFLATCEARDREMTQRIKLHRDARPKQWKTFEEARDLTPLVNKLKGFDCIIIDCLTLLVSNLLLHKLTHEQIIGSINDLLASLRKKNATVILVSNEVGLGIVPINKLARDFRDIAGCVNQLVAQKATQVFFMASGLALKIKGTSKC